MPYSLHALARATRSATACRLGFALLAGFAPLSYTPALLAADAASVQRSIAFDVAAGPLDQALGQFGRQAGIPIAANAGLTAGKRSPGVQGRFAVADGFARLLAGTGLAGVAQADGSYLLMARSATDDTLELGATMITGSALGQITEGSGSYTIGATRTATRLPLTLRETPQTVTVVTRQQMDDLGMRSMSDVLEGTSGVFVQRAGGNGDTAYSRGFSMQTQYDGVPNPWGIGESNRGPSPDSAFFDHVEVLQGAAGLLSGAGEAGGTVNMVRKLPTEHTQALVEVGGGSWDRKRLVGDVSGPLVTSGRVRGRAVAVWQDGNSFIDYNDDSLQGFYGVLMADLDELTTLTGSIQYQKNRTVEALGIPTARDGQSLGLSRSSFFGTDWGRIKRDSVLYSLRLDRQLGGEWVVRASYDHGETHTDDRGSYLYGTLNPATGNGLSLNWNLLERRFVSDALDVHASGPFELAGRRHELVLGASGVEQRERSRGRYYGQPINLYGYHPSSIVKPGDSLPAWPDFAETRQQGVYAAARLSLADPLKLILGARVSQYRHDTEKGVTSAKETGVVTPYAGLVYELTDWASAYASYSDIFQPQTYRQSAGSTLDPVLGSNYELGLKGEFYDGHLNAAVAVFRLEQENLAKRDDSIAYDVNNACGGWCYQASGLVISQGLDMSLNGEVVPGWQVAAGYTYVKSRYGKGEQSGDPYMTELPDHVLRASTSYRLPGTPWTLGGDVRLQSDIHARGNGYRVEQGGITVVGLQGKYQVSEAAEITLAVRNLFDREYYQAVSGPWWGTLYAEPRNAMLSWRQTF